MGYMGISYFHIPKPIFYLLKGDSKGLGSRACDLGCRVWEMVKHMETTVMENQVQKKMNNEIESCRD